MKIPVRLERGESPQKHCVLTHYDKVHEEALALIANPKEFQAYIFKRRVSVRDIDKVCDLNSSWTLFNESIP